MKELKITIDGVTHKYVKVPISESSCNGCSLNEFCRLTYCGTHLCKIFDPSGKCRPTGVYGHFETIENE